MTTRRCGARTVTGVKPAGDKRTPDGHEYALDGPSDEQLLNVTVDDGDVLLVKVRGEIDGLTAPRLRHTLDDAFDRLGGRVLVLDLTEVDFLGSAGLRVLLDSARTAALTPGYQPMRVVIDDNRAVALTIEIVGLDHVLALYDSVNDAVTG